MKLIDRTPLQNENGEIGIVQRIQGTLQYGMSWYPELQAQKSILPQLERTLKDFTIIRNHALGTSGIIIPLIMIGPPGIIVAHVTHLTGTFRAKGDAWLALKGSKFQPTAVNLLARTDQFSRALLVFLERQGLKRTLTVEPVLIAANPGMYVESQRPLVRVVMSDAVERWATSVSKSPPILTPVAAEELAERIIKPSAPKQESAEESLQAHPSAEEAPPEMLMSEDEFDSSLSYQDSVESEGINSSDLSFAFDDEDEAIPPGLIESSPSIPLPVEKNGPGRYLGMTVKQLALLGGMLVVEICVLISFAAIIFLNS